MLESSVKGHYGCGPGGPCHRMDAIMRAHVWKLRVSQYILKGISS